MRPRLAATVLGISCLVSQFDAVAGGKNAPGALKLLGQFALNIASGLVSNKAQAIIDRQNAGATQEPRISGYRFEFTWTADDVVYSGFVTMQGTTGHALITVRDMTILQDMVAQRDNGDVILSGSTPRYLVLTPANEFATTPAHEYSPDRFRITRTPQGGWTIADTCDYRGRCAAVIVTNASAF